MLLRARRYPNPLPRIPDVSEHLQIVGLADPGESPTSRSRKARTILGAAILVSPKAGHSFTAADAARFGAGCILYPPVGPVIRPLGGLSLRRIDRPERQGSITDRGCALNQDPRR